MTLKFDSGLVNENKEPLCIRALHDNFPNDLVPCSDNENTKFAIGKQSSTFKLGDQIKLFASPSIDTKAW
jgi:hypothetical protein